MDKKALLDLFWGVVVVTFPVWGTALYSLSLLLLTGILIGFVTLCEKVWAAWLKLL